MGLFSGFGKTAGNVAKGLFGSDEAIMRLARAQAFARDDYGGAANISAQLMAPGLEAKKQEEELRRAIMVANATAAAKAQYREPTALQQNVEYLNKQFGDLGNQYARNYAEGPPIAVDVASPDGSVTRQFLPRAAMGGMPQPSMPSQNVPMGSPTQGAPNSKVVNTPTGPKQIWLVNGEWYDNPEGR